ncbi:hypothetical protein [Melittangium boletus]|uniref:Lipoprotein n=1 Tax=Melittangium boletus DSM 14713 TaxID=1294270 RepID=A0A250IB97_9BACT|nr:hypothetical protein [Melittangium boletus]ATB29144.1 hypothetical protein MEBOL_002593 [Melittangium boletus DSM 14713]
MALKTGFFALAFSALLFIPVAAQADDTARVAARHDASPVTIARAPSGGSWHNATPPRPNTSRRDGRYELRTVQKQVPGRYERVWVAERCEPVRRRAAQRCEPGHYERRWVPGYTETQQEWVWVAFPRGSYGRG